MKFWEAIRLALLQLRAHKLKSFFTLLGVIIGVTFLIAVVAVVEGVNRFVREDFATAVFGVNTLQIHRRETVHVGREDIEKRRRQARNPFLTVDDAETLRRAIPGIWRFAYSDDAFLPEIRFGEHRRKNIRVLGVSEGYLELQGWDVVLGRGLTSLDHVHALRVAVIGDAIAQRLFPDRSPLGHRIRVGPNAYEIVGVLKRQGGLLGNIRDASLLIPYRAFEGDFSRRRDVVDEIAMKFRTTKEMEEAELEVEAVMRVRHRLRPGEENDFAIESATELLDVWKTLNRILLAALPGLVAISLVVGGIVIMNIMLMSVLERTREIGIRKAIGARRRDILLQFLIESATLSVTGAVAGIVLGLALAWLVRVASPLPAAAAPWSLVAGVALGLLVGLFFGAYPAYRAANLDPITALRYE